MPMVTRLISALVVIVVIALRQLTAVCVLRLKPTLEAIIGLAFVLRNAVFASLTSGLFNFNFVSYRVFQF